MKISIVGGGYVGLVTSACLADLGHDVTVIDLDPSKVQQINEKNPPLCEEHLEDLLKNTVGKSLHATTRFDSITSSELTILCVGTPRNMDGSADLRFIESASRSIGTALKDARDYQVVVVKSTVPPGTTETVVRPIVLKAAQKKETEIGFVMNPEFLREGLAVTDFMHPDRIVIGGNESRAGDIVAQVYKDIPAPVIRTGTQEAEMIKYASNAFLATKISFSNEIGNVCKHLGIDVYAVMQGVGRDHRIGPQFLNAGAGYGGSCFPKDVSALIALAEQTGEDPVLLKSVQDVNERQPSRMVALLEEKIGVLAGKRIAVLGLAFKDNTDDIRDSRSIPVIRELLDKGAFIIAFDPMAMPNMKQILPEITYAETVADALVGADGCLVMTEWPEFKKIDKEFDCMAHPVIIEGRRILSRKGVVGICWQVGNRP